ncbi:hypothetical protein PILCRDRAFT_821645 [Piloderma croceum F 1598]|uniref:Uncharacterized protein n=1 Tax=Piloderma croceum (strain F 1598) TaxID=765440 RepID=A0A0C3BV51_PILCF|nr:hypothetical protein PILCRDRAFT_821645 [Piloderma croceum F 1598]
MDGFDLLATTPCGSGKLGYLILLMLVVREIAADETRNWKGGIPFVSSHDCGVPNQRLQRRT